MESKTIFQLSDYNLQDIPSRIQPSRIRQSQSLFGKPTVDMLLQVHRDALWILENLGMECVNEDMTNVFSPYEAEGLAIVHEGRIYISADCVNQALEKIPGIGDFPVPENSMVIGGSAAYIYDDKAGHGGIIPTQEHLKAIARFANECPSVAGMGRGVTIGDEVAQLDVMASHCHKPIYAEMTTNDSVLKGRQLLDERGNVMVMFCPIRPPFRVGKNIAPAFVQAIQAGLPLVMASMPMAGLSAPFCYNGVLAITHAEVLFGFTVAQLMKPGLTCVHAGFPTIADPAIDYSPNLGLKSHNLLNILLSHLCMMLDLPAFQSCGTTHEEHPTEKAMENTRTGIAMYKKFGGHMMRHPFGFLRYLIDFSIGKMERTAAMVEDIKPEHAPEIPMPVYDPRGMDSIQQYGLGSYMADPLTTANLGRIFTD